MVARILTLPSRLRYRPDTASYIAMQQAGALIYVKAWR